MRLKMKRSKEKGNNSFIYLLILFNPIIINLTAFLRVCVLLI